MQHVYLHGLGQKPDSWEKTIAQLQPAGDILCPDLAELCQGEPAAFQTLSNGFSAICHGLEKPIVLCGLSLGGVLALHYAIQHPENVRALVLIATPYKMPKGALKAQNLLFRFMPGAMFQETGFGKDGTIQLCRTMMELDFSGAVPAVACPTLVVCGERDGANKKATAALAGLLKNGELQIIPGAGHEVNKDAPEALAEALRHFYSKLQ